MLKRFRIDQYCEGPRTKEELELKANALFMGAPSKLIRFLKHYGEEQDRLRQKITLPVLLKDIAENGFERRLTSDDARVAPVTEQLSSNFVDSIEPFLISRQLIHRPETQDIVDATGHSGVVLVKAEAGMGKSATLLEVHNLIRSIGAVSLPIRLDRNRPENNADTFGRALGFTHSPIYCLSKFAPNQKCVVILDQLDAVRWTASHSSNALDVCKQLVKQSLSLREEIDISVILACRDFEIDEDVALRAWVESLSEDITVISLGKLTRESVAEKIKPYEAFDSLSIEKQNVLMIPLWLCIYLDIAARDQRPPVFSSKLELVKRFWISKYEDLGARNVSTSEANLALDELVQFMERESRLSVPALSVPPSFEKVIEGLISVGILTRNADQISFRHQALYDYRLGEKLYNAALVSGKELLEKIGSPSEQTLTMREHLRYALNMLLARGHSGFCGVILELLESSKVRFHIKYLILSVLRELDSLKGASKVLIGRVIENEELKESFVAVSCRGNGLFVKHLSDSQYIGKWLNSGNEVEINRALELLSSVSVETPDTVLREMEPFVGRSENWNKRVHKALCWNIEDDSDAMFDVRKRLLADNVVAPFINWHTLSKKHPKRVIELVELLLDHYRQDIAAQYLTRPKSSKMFAHRDKWSQSDLESISEANAADPELTISKLLSIIHEYSEDSDDAAKNWLERNDLGLSDTISCITRGVRSMVQNAAQQLASEGSASLISVVTPFLTKDSLLANHINAKILLNLSTDHADLVTTWILDSPANRLSCGNTNVEPRWLLPAKLVEKFSPHCSEHLLKSLESSILNQQATCDIESIKWKLDVRSRGYYPSFWGEPQYFILPRLPASKISNQSHELLKVLKRRFESYRNEDFYNARRGRGGYVVSPLSDPNALSNNAWSRLILSSQNLNKVNKSIKYGEDTILESSVEQFARSFDQAVKNQPTRFAELALTLPSKIDHKYIRAFYWGLSENDPKHVDERFREEWNPCPPELVEAVVNHFGRSTCVSALIRMLDSRYSENGTWSVETRELIINIAKNAENPSSNKLSVVKNGESSDADDANPDSLESTALNCDRGIAFRKLGDLFWDNEELSLELRHLVQDAIDDPHPAVNVVALRMVLPIFRYDDDFASSTFLSLCEKDIRASVARGSHYFFNNGFEGPRQEEYIKLVFTMLESNYKSVRKEGATQVVARWYFNDLFGGQLLDVLNGEEIAREGAATVVAQFAKDSKFQTNRNKLLEVFELLVSDESKDVRRVLAGSVRHAGFWEGALSSQLFSIYVKSKAALHDLYGLFNTIDKHIENLLEYQTELFSLINNITENVDENAGMHIRESALVNVLQRLYDQATEDEDQEGINLCLDIWDKLLYSNIYSATTATRGLDKGLLS